MSGYQHILCALDLNDDSLLVATRAAELAQLYHAQLSLQHVDEYIPIDLANELVLPQQQEIEQQLVSQATAHLASLAKKVDGGQLGEHVVQGSTKSEIIGFANSHQVDLIVLGRHGRHGISRLLGSVANSVLHHASCDVLAVRVGS